MSIKQYTIQDGGTEFPQTSGDPLDEPRDTVRAMLDGARKRCPNCRAGTLFATHLKTAESCSNCGEAFHHHRADDAPPYFVILIVGHFVIGFVLALETTYAPPVWVQQAIWIPTVLVLSWILLPIVKGAIVGLQWAQRMHGFGGMSDEDEICDPERAHLEGLAERESRT